MPWDFADNEPIEYEPGYKYEIIHGSLYVSPQPDLAGARLDSWMFVKLHYYTTQHPEIINYVNGKARVYVPGQQGLTVPEPDVTAYHDFPIEADIEDVAWQDVSPILTVEVLTGDPDKDLVRNVDLYWQVPSIREYWVLDGRESQSRPSLKVYRRHGKRWVIRDYPFDSVYTTRMLPGFELRINPKT